MTTHRFNPNAAAPLVTLESTPYWQACNEERLLLKQCNACGKTHFYPRDICPHCLSADTHWIEASGQATLYSFSRTFTKDGEYAIAYVRLAEGVTLMTNLVDYDPGGLAIDMPLRVTFVPSKDGSQKLPMFRPLPRG